MKRYVIGWALIVFAGMLVVACGITASPPKSDGSIEPSERHGNVENGSVSDQAKIDLGGVKKVILPDTAVIWRTGRSGALELFMDKTLAFYGWPPRPITLVDVRNNMGCATRIEGDALILATFGEWDSHIEGSARMRLVAVVPDEVDVVQRNGLSGRQRRPRFERAVFHHQRARARRLLVRSHIPRDRMDRRSVGPRPRLGSRLARSATWP